MVHLELRSAAVLDTGKYPAKPPASSQAFLPVNVTQSLLMHAGGRLYVASSVIEMTKTASSRRMLSTAEVRKHQNHR